MPLVACRKPRAACPQRPSAPVHALSHLFAFELLTRIRNSKDRTLFRPDREHVYEHTDSLFGAPGENVIDWELIAAHWRHLMRIVLSIRDGRLFTVPAVAPLEQRVAAQPRLQGVPGARPRDLH